MKIEFQDKIDDFLLNRMSAEERTTFEKDVESNNELQEQLAFTEDVKHVMKSRNEKLAKIKEWENDYLWENDRDVVSAASEYCVTGSGDESISSPQMMNHRIPHRLLRKRFLYWVSGVAAVFIAGFFLIQDLYMTKSLNVYETSTIINGTSFRAGSDYSDIEMLLRQGEYKDALKLIEERSKTLINDSLKIVQDTTINIERKEYDMQIVKYKNDKLKWLKVHALLGLEQGNEALLILNELRRKEGYYQILADSLYYHIKR